MSLIMGRPDYKISNSFRTKLTRQLAIIFVTTVLIIFVAPVGILILLPTSIVLRLLVKMIAAIYRPDLSKMVSGKATIFAVESIYTNPKTNMLLYLFCDKEPVEIKEFIRQFEQRLLNYTDDSGVHPYEKLTQTLTNFMGFTFWKRDEDFRSNNHLRLYDYTAPELALPGKCSEDDLKRVSGALLARPWVEGRSPWEALIVPDYRTTEEPEKLGFVVILRIHHALADGYSLLTTFLRVTDSFTAQRIFPKFPNLTVFQKVCFFLLMLLKLPYVCAELIVDYVDGPNCWHFLWRKLSREPYVFFSNEIDIDKMKKIKNKYGVDYNSATFAITAGSIQRLMLDSGNELPESLSVFLPFPMPNHPGGLVVHTSAAFFRLFSKLAPADNIVQIAANLKIAKENPSVPTALSWLTDMASLFPTWLLTLVHNKMMSTIVMTSFPGPEVEIPAFGEAKCTGICLSIGLTPNKFGAVASILTMAGKQRITLTVDKSIFEGYKVPTRFAEYVDKEIEALLS